MSLLSSDEIARWPLDLDQRLWDDQLDVDSDSGKLDFLFDETLRNWPPPA
jgi:hypothetical protein